MHAILQCSRVVTRAAPPVPHLGLLHKALHLAVLVHDHHTVLGGVVHLHACSTAGTRLGHNAGVEILVTPPGYQGGMHGFPPELVYQSPTPQGFLLGRVKFT